jgi:hypothetical protein
LADKASNLELFKALSANLCKNSSALRLETLKILRKFEVLKYTRPKDPEQEVSENYIDKKCECINLMYEYENFAVGFETQKAKEQALETLAVMIKSGLLPDLYTEIIYNFLIGCFWVRFTLIFENVQDCIAQIFTSLDADGKVKYITRHVEIMQTATWLAQVDGHENARMLEQLHANVNKSKLQGTDIVTQAYIKETQVDEQFIETKDFFYQVCRSVSGILGTCILPQKQLREPLFNMFYLFIEKEYVPLH